MKRYPKADIVDRVISDVVTRMSKAEDKFPKWPHCHVRAVAIVGEEYGELAQAAVKHRYEDGDIEAIYDEALDVAAMAFRLLCFLRKLVIYKDQDGVPVIPMKELIEKSK